MPYSIKVGGHMEKCSVCEHKITAGLGRCRCSTWYFYEEGGWYHQSFTPDVEKLIERADSHIERGTVQAHDAASSVGQIFDNVKHMNWFRYAVMDELKEWR